MMFKHLFTPGKIGDLVLENRIVMSPMVTQFSRSGEVTTQMVNYYAARARGGPALIVVEAAFPRQGGQPGRLGIYDDRFLPGLRELVKAIHEAGTKVALQINPSRARSCRIDPVSASGIPHPTSGVKPRVLTVAEIQHIEDEFGKGVVRAMEAGADAIMIHGGNGYLVCEFLSPRTNRRRDEYGGDLRGRARLALELVEVAREKIGPNFPVIFRLMGDERLDGGFTLKEAIEVSRLLQAAGVDAIDIVSGVAESREWIIPSMYFPRGCNVSLSEAVKKVVTVPVSVAGRINDPYLADEILMKGQADFVNLGRALIADPEFPRKAAEGRIDDIRPCIACLRCTESGQLDQPLVCAVNYAVGKEATLQLSPAPVPKTVLIVGGGPAGMQAAVVAAARGHQVTLWEKDRVLGGQINLAVVPPHKEEFRNAVRFLERQLAKHGVEVVLNREADVQSVVDLAPDVVVLATGSKPVMPPTAGGKTGRTVNSDDVLSGKVRPGNRVAVIGGGMTGCETAEFVAQMAEEVSLVELLDEIATDTIRQIRKLLLRRLAERNVRSFTGVVREQITDGGIEMEDKTGHRHIVEADQIIVAAGRAPNTDLLDELHDKVADVYVIGDAHEPSRILEAIHEGFEAGLKL